MFIKLSNGISLYNASTPLPDNEAYIKNIKTAKTALESIAAKKLVVLALFLPNIINIGILKNRFSPA
ncbi:MAG: hypothetical protein IKL77_03195 [Clostridia bacterium]|nr:hypothetical protein [Clostridia bacterium]